MSFGECLQVGDADRTGRETGVADERSGDTETACSMSAIGRIGLSASPRSLPHPRLPRLFTCVDQWIR